MIPQADVIRWSQTAPWSSPDQVEQDLVLSRLMVEIANHEALKTELVMRGGTCLHKLWLPRASRYSEDLDYVRTTAGGVGPLLDALREIAAAAGFEDVRSQISRHPKLYLRSTTAAGSPLRVKVEMNTFERAPARPATRRRLEVASTWFAGTADVPTFTLEELVATKLRALFQRSKGRDAFDVWLAQRAFDVDPNEVAACFAPYRPSGWTPAAALANLDAKLASMTFLADLRPLVREWPDEFDADAARAAVVRFLDVVT